MKIKNLLFFVVSFFVISCDSEDTSAESEDSSSNVDLTGVWTRTNSGNYFGTCLDTPPDSLDYPSSTSFSYTLAEDGTYTTDAYSLLIDCANPEDDEMYQYQCVGEWVSDGTSVFFLNDMLTEMTDITNINDVIAFGDQWFSFYELNDDLTEFSIGIESTTGLGDMCQYDLFVKQ